MRRSLSDNSHASWQKRSLEPKSSMERAAVLDRGSGTRSQGSVRPELYPSRCRVSLASPPPPPASGQWSRPTLSSLWWPKRCLVVCVSSRPVFISRVDHAHRYGHADHSTRHPSAKVAESGQWGGRGVGVTSGHSGVLLLGGLFFILSDLIRGAFT